MANSLESLIWLNHPAIFVLQSKYIIEDSVYISIDSETGAIFGGSEVNRNVSYFNIFKWNMAIVDYISFFKEDFSPFTWSTEQTH